MPKTVLRLENFKSIEKATIELKPITMLFGPNGAGKSSFIKALLFLSENLENIKRNRATFKINDQIDLGSFEEIVSGNDTTKKIKFEIEYFPDEDTRNNFSEKNEDPSFDRNRQRPGRQRIDDNDLFILNDSEKSFDINLKENYDSDGYLISEDTQENSTYDHLSEGSINEMIESEDINLMDLDFEENQLPIKPMPKIDEKYLIDNDELGYTDQDGWRRFRETVMRAGGGNINLELDVTFKFAITYKLLDGNTRIDSLKFYDPTTTAYYEVYFEDITEKFSVISVFSEDSINTLFEKFFKDSFKPRLFDTSDYSHGFLSFKGELKRYIYDKLRKNRKWKAMGTSKKSSVFHQILFFFYFVQDYIPHKIFDMLKYKHMPTLRELPPHVFTLRNGIFEGYYDIPLQIEAFQKYKLQMFDNMETYKFLEILKLHNLVSNFKIEKDQYTGKLFFQTPSTKTWSNLAEASSGLLQILPIIYSCCSSNYVLIEQPELHLHPKLQCALTNIFVDLISLERKYHEIKIKDVKTSHGVFLIETHSEHILRRFQILVANGELSSDLINIYYFDNKKGLTNVIDMEISSNGLLQKQWPDGFFDDSANLTFELLEALRRQQN